jgi:hypothetical protein
MVNEPTSAATSRSEQTAGRPVRDADDNQELLTRDAPATDRQLLPSLDAGVTVLDIEGGRGVPVLQALVLDHLLLQDGPAYWVDASGHATTTTLARIAPSQRLLDRVYVARGFTAYQHYAAVCDLPVTQQSEQSTDPDATRSRTGHDGETSEASPALVVAPAVDAQYRADDTLGTRQAETLQTRALARLRRYADDYDVPVIVTRSRADTFTTPVETVADHHIECRQTPMGPRFVGDEFETLLYPVGDGTAYQTTFAYWRQLLATRATEVGVEPTASSDPADSPTAVGAGVTTDGETATCTPNPLLDAWTGPAGTGGR